MKRTLTAVLVAALATTAGCSAAPEPKALCPNGGLAAAVEDKAICVWEQAITETGFRCPRSMPNGYMHDDRFVCSDDPQHSPEELTELVDRTLPSPNGPSEFMPNRVDILWVVDNSGSMCEEQASIRENAENFTRFLTEIGADFNLAVITTDVVDTAQKGRFQNVPDGQTNPSCDIAVDVSNCPSGLPRVIRSDDPRYLNDPEALQRDFGCIVTVGTEGNGFEAGLEAAKLALSPPLSNGFNSEFMRDDALLAIVFVSDENDCSDRGALDKFNSDICEWEEDRLVPTQEYVDFFTQLKGGDPNKLIMTGIIAPDTGIRYMTGQETQVACFSDEGGDGYSSYRYEEVIEAFPNHFVSNICEPPFDRALEAFGMLSQRVLKSVCLRDRPALCLSNRDCPQGDVCATRGGSELFCSSLQIRVEVLRDTPIESRACAAITETGFRCVLQDGLDFQLDYNAAQCSGSPVAVDLIYNPAPDDQIVVRYPRSL